LANGSKGEFVEMDGKEGILERERRIRERAYRLWEEEGRPEGREHEHWTRASDLIHAEERDRVATPDAPEARKPRQHFASAGSQSKRDGEKPTRGAGQRQGAPRTKTL
jgi:hypothetical protein